MAKILKAYSNEDINKALSGIKNKCMTRAEASKKYKIPESTLRNRLMKETTNKLKKKYSPESVENALADINNKKILIVVASKKYGIPVQTLRDRLKNIHNKPYGSSTILCDEVGSHLADWTQLFAKAGYPKSKA